MVVIYQPGSLDRFFHPAVFLSAEQSTRRKSIWTQSKGTDKRGRNACIAQFHTRQPFEKFYRRKVGKDKTALL